jgi:hypothetical protein
LCARSDFTELGDERGEQGGVAGLPERVYAKLAEDVMLKRLFPAGCYEGGCGSNALWVKTVLVRPVVGANEQARSEFSAETGCLPLGVRVAGGCRG